VLRRPVIKLVHRLLPRTSREKFDDEDENRWEMNSSAATAPGARQSTASYRNSPVARRSTTAIYAFDERPLGGEPVLKIE
jgi:hypothetical protein